MSHPAGTVVARLKGGVVHKVVRDDDGALGLVVDGSCGLTYLRTGDAGWRLWADGAVIDGSYDDTRAGVGGLVGGVITAVDVAAPIPDTTIDFADGPRLEILSTAAQHPAWYWLARDGQCMAVGRGATWAEGQRGDRGGALPAGARAMSEAVRAMFAEADALFAELTE